MIFKKSFLIAILLFLLIVSNSKAQTTITPPESVITKSLLKPNATSYIFKIPLRELRNIIIKTFGIRPQMDNKILEKIFYYNWPETGDVHKNQVIFSPETSGTGSFGSEYFANPGTKDDIFLTQMADYWYSTLYYHNGKPFEFTSSYAIQFKRLNDKSTLITIKAIGPEIVNGTLCCSPHGNYSRTEKVTPTTVEEYTLILFIAEKLGVKNLKPLMLPQ